MSLVLLLIGILSIGKDYTNYQTEVNSAESTIREFRDTVSIQEHDDTEQQKDSNILGVLTIPALNIEGPVALGTDESILQQYIALLPGTGEPGEEGNPVFASHSARNNFLCSYCWFQKIDELKIGDEIRILWKDGWEYIYEVTEVKTWISEAEVEDLLPVPGKEMITLQTCTKGQQGVRTYVHAERKS